MKRAPFIFIALFWALAGNGQKLNIDKLTGDSSWISSMEKLYSRASFTGTVGELLNVSCIKSKAGLSLGFFIRTADLSADLGIEKLQIKTGSGKIIELKKSGDDVLSGLQTIHVFFITKDDAETLGKDPVTFIRFTGINGLLDYEIKSKFQKKISDCISQVFAK